MSDQHEEISFLDRVRAVVAEKNNDIYATWYDQNGRATDEYTFGRLWEDAGQIAYYLREKWGIKKGDKVVLCYNFGLHFFAAFLGCVRAGVTAVLVYPPGPPLKKSLTKMTTVVNDCQPVAILTDGTITALKKMDELNPLSQSKHMWPSNIKYFRTDAAANSRSASWFGVTSSKKSFDEPTIHSQDLCFLQYTSGSTGTPKGVMVTHGNLAANVRLIQNGHNASLTTNGRVHNNSDDVGFSWVPQYHDLGLIVGSIAPFANGWRMHMMSPITFIKNPLLWIELLSNHRIAWSVAPNFAFDLVARKYQETLQNKHGGNHLLFNLDLSCVLQLRNAAEPIGLDSKQKFLDCFQPHGLRENYFRPCYGLAEHVVLAVWSDSYHISKLRSEDTCPFVACTHRAIIDPSLLVKIVDSTTCTEVQDEKTGEVWLASPSKAVGYFGKTDLSKEVFQAKLQGSKDDNTTFLRTGDLGFFQNDYLYICGRIKDTIIVNGVNYYPQDMERSAQNASPGVRPGCVAAFSADETATGGSRVAIVFEIRKNSEAQAESVCQVIHDAVTKDIGLIPSLVVAIKERTIPKTTSGKIQRRKTRQCLHDELLDIVFVLEPSDDADKFVEAPKLQQHPTLDDKEPSDPQQQASEGTCAPSMAIDLTSKDEPSSNKKFDSIVASILGPGFNPSASWETNGLSSMGMVELTNKLSHTYPVSIPPDFQEKFRTPDELRQLVLGPSKGSFFTIELDDLEMTQKSALNPHMPHWLLTMLQGLGIACLWMVLSVSTIPAYYFVRSLSDANNGQWMATLLPLTLVIWSFSFSVMVILLKWLVIGKYRKQMVSVSSLYFLRWWFVDRAVELWEFLTGGFIISTPLIWIFYRLMGTQLSPSVKIDGFLREFDLIEIDSGACIERSMRCRKFGHQNVILEGSGAVPTLRFRPVTVETKSTIRGQVGLGANIGEGSCIEKLAAVPEGAQVPAQTHAVGNPAFHDGTIVTQDTSEPNLPFQPVRVIVGLAKLLWILSVLYMAAFFAWFGMLIFGDLFDHLAGWRYGQLFQLIVLAACTTFTGMMSTIPIKWLLIGRRMPNTEESELQCLCYWMADYHYNIYRRFFELVAANSVAVNLIFKAMGMDIDCQSKVWLICFSPSKMDLISIKQSFISCANFDVKSNGKPQLIKVHDCSVGHSATLCGGTTLQHCEILPYSHIASNMYGDKMKWNERKELPTGPQKLLVDLAALPLLALLFVGLIPSYEVFQNTSILNNVLPGLTFPTIRVALAVAVHTATWYVIYVILTRLVFCFTKDTPGKMDARGVPNKMPLSLSMYAIYLTVVFYIWDFSLLQLLYGSPFINLAIAGLGGTIKGRLWYFGHRMHDPPFAQFEGPATVVDSSLVSGHYAVQGTVELGTCRVAGVLHEGTVCLANTNLSDPLGEVGPMHFVAPQAESAAGSDTLDIAKTLHNDGTASANGSSDQEQLPPV